MFSKSTRKRVTTAFAAAIGLFTSAMAPAPLPIHVIDLAASSAPLPAPPSRADILQTLRDQATRPGATEAEIKTAQRAVLSYFENPSENEVDGDWGRKSQAAMDAAIDEATPPTLDDLVDSLAWRNGCNDFADTPGVCVVGGHYNNGPGTRKRPTAGASTHHKGTDITADHGSAINATERLYVYAVGRNGGYGHYVVVGLPDGRLSMLAHLSAVNVKAGQYVATGKTIGHVGATGVATGPHLHYELARYERGQWRVDALREWSASSTLRAVANDHNLTSVKISARLQPAPQPLLIQTLGPQQEMGAGEAFALAMAQDDTAVTARPSGRGFGFMRRFGIG